MLIETEKKKICMNQIVGQKKEEISVSDDVIVNDIKPDVLNIINTSGITYVYKKDVMDGKCKIDGNINIYIMYLADDETNSVRSLNTVLDFSQIINMESCKEGMNLDEDIVIKGFECKILNSRKINIIANLEISAKIYSKETIEIIEGTNDIEDMQVLKNSKEINCLLGDGEVKVSAKDNIAIDSADDLAEIMKTSIKIINKETKISYNKILAKADAEINVIYSTEDNRINELNAQIPIMGFIDMENVDENNFCDTNYKIKNLIIKPNNTEMHSIYVEIEMEISSFVYERKNINLIEDLYSISSEVEYKQKQIMAKISNSNLKDICQIKEQINLPEMNNNKLYNVEVMPVINDTKIQGNRVIYDGNVKLKFLFEMNNSIGIKDIELPFRFETSSDDINKDRNIETNIEVKTENFIVTSNGNIEANIELEFNIEVIISDTINIIDEINCKECNQEDIYSMVIYFVKPGDTMWQIAKKFKTTIEEIKKLNDIEDENEIMPNMQLYIPKHINKNIVI